MNATKWIVLALTALSVDVGVARAQSCSVPSHEDAATTLDQHYLDNGWRCSGDWMSFFLSHYDMNQNDWDDGFGWDQPCDLGRPLARTFNGIYTLHYSHRDPPRRTDDFSGSILRWGGNYAMDHIDELDAGCGDGSAYARTQYGPFVDNWTDLYLGFFYEEWPVERAGTLLHESRHAAGVGHDAGENCGRKGSCDPEWNTNGANTWQVLWLWWYAVDAVNAPPASRTKALDRANLILATAFANDPGFRIDQWGREDPCFDWGGAWLMTWDSPTGAYNNVTILAQSGLTVTGAYPNGEISGALSGPQFEEVLDGTWRRTSGPSGGACQYGKVHLDQYFDRAANTCKATGRWDYCENGSPTWAWTGTRIFRTP